MQFLYTGFVVFFFYRYRGKTKVVKKCNFCFVHQLFVYILMYNSKYLTGEEIGFFLWPLI